jgi:hypothetical protein
MKKNIVITVAVVIVVGLAAFFGGMAVGKGSAAGALRNQFAALRNGGTTSGFARTGGQSAGFLAGSVISMDSQSITLQGRDGSSHIIFYATSTAVSKEVSTTIGDVKPGDEITAMGTANPDGSFTASSISIGGGRAQSAGPQQAPMVPAGQ